MFVVSIIRIVSSFFYKNITPFNRLQSYEKNEWQTKGSAFFFDIFLYL